MTTPSPTPIPTDPTLVFLNNISSILSLLGGIYIILGYIRKTRFWSATGKMIVCLTISDFLYTIANLLSNCKESAPVCQLSGFLRIFGSLSSFFWATRIARMAFGVFRDIDCDVDPRIYSWTSLIKGFTVPLIIAVIPLFNFDFVNYGSFGTDCGIKSNVKGVEKYIYLLTIFMPMAICLLMTVFYYGRLLALSPANFEDFRVERKSFFWYPLGHFICWIPALVSGVVFQFMGTNRLSFILDALRIIFAHSSGFVNAFIYGWTRRALTVDEEPKESLLTSHVISSIDLSRTVDKSYKIEL